MNKLKLSMKIKRFYSGSVRKKNVYIEKFLRNYLYNKVKFARRIIYTHNDYIDFYKCLILDRQVGS